MVPIEHLGCARRVVDALDLGHQIVETEHRRWAVVPDPLECAGFHLLEADSQCAFDGAAGDGLACEEKGRRSCGALTSSGGTCLGRNG